jgi:hypothetical protein
MVEIEMQSPQNASFMPKIYRMYRMAKASQRSIKYRIPRRKSKGWHSPYQCHPFSFFAKLGWA